MPHSILNFELMPHSIPYQQKLEGLYNCHLLRWGGVGGGGGKKWNVPIYGAVMLP